MSAICTWALWMVALSAMVRTAGGGLGGQGALILRPDLSTSYRFLHPDTAHGFSGLGVLT
jgi:hypothetical protein